MNVMKLKGKIREKGLTQEMLARKINIDKSTLSRRLNNGDTFTIGEADKISCALELSEAEAIEIFLRK